MIILSKLTEVFNEMNIYTFLVIETIVKQHLMKTPIFLVLLISVLVVSSCSSTKTVQKDNDTTLKKEVPVVSQETNKESENNQLFYFSNDKLRQLEINGKIVSTVDGSKQSASTSVLVKERDSIGMTIFGPFGILVGQLMASPANFMFYNAFGNEVIEGEPSSANINSVTGMPISFDDIMTLLRGEVPFGMKGYQKVRTLESGETLYSFKDQTQTHFVTTGVNGKDISQYQRKNNDGELLFHIRYANYKNVNNISVATESTLQIPKMKTSISFVADEVFINEPFQSKLTFPVPSGVKRKKLN